MSVSLLENTPLPRADVMYIFQIKACPAVLGPMRDVANGDWSPFDKHAALLTTDY